MSGAASLSDASDREDDDLLTHPIYSSCSESGSGSEGEDDVARQLAVGLRLGTTDDAQGPLGISDRRGLVIAVAPTLAACVARDALDTLLAKCTGIRTPGLITWCSHSR